MACRSNYKKKSNLGRLLDLEFPVCFGKGIADPHDVPISVGSGGCVTQKIFTILVLAIVGLCYSAPAKADNIHLCDINSITTCNAGSVIPVSSGTTQAWAFGTANSSETLFIAVLTPVRGGSGNFNSTTNLWSALGVSPNQVFPDLASTQSQEFGATGITAGSFNASSFQVGAWTGTVTTGQSVTLPNSPIGAIFVAYLVDSNGNLVAVSPWSSSLINVPEPSSMMLLGAGLLALLGGLAGRRRFLGN